MTLFALLLAAAAPAQAAEPPAASMTIAGETRAPNPQIAQAALQEAGGFVLRSLKCGDVGGGAKASLMPKRWVPADPNFRIGPKGARYERWELEACGRTEPFLVVFWKHKGRPDFQVAHPFPAEPVRKVKP